MKKIISAVLTAVMLLAAMPVNAAVANRVIYISPTGNDTDDGSINAPYKSFFRAKLTVDYLRKNGVTENIKIILKSGEYEIDHSLVLDKDMSNVTIEGEEGAVITGGRSFDIADNEPITDTRFSGNSNIKCIDLSDYFSTMENAEEINTQNNGEADYIVAIDNEMLTLARYPNVSDIQNEGYFKPATIVASGDSTASRSQFSFTYTEDNISTWSKPSEIFVEGYGDVLWKYQKIGVESIDAETKTVTSRNTKLYSAISAPNANPIINAGAQLWFSNVAEELDVPGEYYIDRADKKLYIYPTKATGTVTVSGMKEALIKVIGADNLTLKNLKLTNTRADGVVIKYADGAVVDGCEMAAIGDKAVDIAYSKNSGVQNCYISDMGQGGVKLGMVERSNLENSSNFVKNTEITDYSRVIPTYSPAVSDFGVGDAITNNTIHDGFHQGIALSGNNASVAYNDIYDVVKGSADAGAVYMYKTPYARGNVIENNYIHDIAYADRTPGEEVYGIYFDGGASGQVVRNNLLHNMRNGIFINGGGYFNIEGNIFSNVHNCAVRATPSNQLNAAEFWYGYTSQSLNRAVWENSYPEISASNRWTEYEDAYKNIILSDNIYNYDTTFSDNVQTGTLGVVYRNSCPVVKDQAKATSDIFVNSAKGDFTFKSAINEVTGFDISTTGAK